MPGPPGTFNVELAPGFPVGEYVIESKIGDGGFGTVYRATHPVIGKSAAVKILRHEYSANPDMVQRFVSEARAVNKIRHRNIIDIFSFGQLADGRRFYVMELLEGRSLDEFLLMYELCAPAVALPILRGIARALDAAHACGVVHRDLKPENVFLVRNEDGGAQVKLLDFGIAKLQSTARSTTRTGTAMGTPHYMSPEQWRGRNVDGRTDIYAFGVVAYRMLTGCLPYDAADVMEIMVIQSMRAPKNPSEVCPGLAEAFDEPIQRMLDRDPDRRPASALLAFEALERAAGNPTPSMTPDYAALSERAQGIARRRGPPSESALSSAPTMAAASTTNTPASLQHSTNLGRRSRAPLVVTAVGLVAAVVVTVGLLRRGGAHSSAGGLVAAPTTAATAPAPPAATSVDAIPAPVASEVSLLVTSVPPNAEVYVGGDRLGVAPGPLSLKKAPGTVTITLKAPGFKAQDVPVASDRDTSVSVQLRALAAAAPVRPAPPRGKDSLETF